MELKVADTGVFITALQCVSRFVEKAHFDFNRDGVRIRSIDPHDFCYVDLHFAKHFFDVWNPIEHPSFGADISKFSRILPNLSHVKEIAVGAGEDGLRLSGSKEWEVSFKISRLTDDPYDLPEPKSINHDACVELSASEFCDLINTASSISSELIFRVSESRFSVEASSGDYQLFAKPSPSTKVRNGGRKLVESHAIIAYFRAIEPLVKKCDNVNLLLGGEKPVRVDLHYSDKAVFSFSFSPKKREPPKRARGGISLPRLTVTKFPEFLVYLANSPDGERVRILKLGHLETEGGDYSRLGKMLGLVGVGGGRIRLTKDGEYFVNIFKSDINQARAYLNKLLLTKVKPYEIMLQSLKKRPMDQSELWLAVNSALARRRIKMDKQDISTMLGLATWCEVIDRKMTLYYFERRGKTP